MKKLKLFFSVLFLFLALTAPVQAQERLLDYFYPEGRSAFYIYEDEKSGPIEKVNVNFERSSNGYRLDRESPIPLIASIRTWWSTDKTAGQNSQSNVRVNLELLKMPAKGEVLKWTTTVNENGTIKQIWEMSARLMMMAVFENGERIAVHALEVKRNVFDPQHNPIPGESVTEYWQKGKGKVKVIQNK